MAVVLVAALYGVALSGVTLAVGPAMLAGRPVPIAAETSNPSIAASPSASANALRTDIAAIVEFDARLVQAREDLRAILKRTPFRASEVATVLRRINTTLLPGIERAGRLALDPASREIGAQLEILYANASATVDQATDLELGSSVGYRTAAQEIVDLFTDLPAIDDRLMALLDPAASPSAVPSGSPQPTASAAPPSSSGPVSSLSPSPGTASPHPGEKLRDPGFEMGIASWSLRATGSGVGAAVSPAAPLGSFGARSLQVNLPAGRSLADVGLGQGPMRLQAGRRYTATVSIRSNAPRLAQLRVVGPSEETYGIAIVEIGPEPVVGSLEFVAVLDERAATFWIDLGGPAQGAVWLDDASLVEQSPT